MHSWYDDNPNIDWNGIGEAAEWIAMQLKRWGRIGVRDWKEKYGTVRVYCDLGWHSLFSITHPGYVYSRYPQWLWTLDIYYLSRIVRLLNFIIIPYHAWLYTFIYGRALKKWPHLRSEILQGADHHELLKKFGVHTVRTADRTYNILYDWHPDNFYVRYPRSEKELEDAEG